MTKKDDTGNTRYRDRVIVAGGISSVIGLLGIIGFLANAFFNGGQEGWFETTTAAMAFLGVGGVALFGGLFVL